MKCEFADMPENLKYSLKDVLERSKVLGYLPGEHIESAASFIEQAIMEGPEIIFGDLVEVTALDETINKIDDASVAHLLRRLYPNASDKVRMAIHQSKGITAWIKRNGFYSKNLAIYQGDQT